LFFSWIGLTWLETCLLTIRPADFSLQKFSWG